MHELVSRVAAATGLDETRAEKAIGIVLSLIRTQGDRDKVDELFAHIPESEALAARHADTGARGAGLLGFLGGSLGGPLAAIGRLQSEGLSMDQIKALGREVLAYAREKADDGLVRQVAESIPGLSAYL